MASSSKEVMLVSEDGEEFAIPVNVATKSILIKNMLEDFDKKLVAPLPNVKSATLAKVVEYLKKHAEHEATAGEGGGETSEAGAGAEERMKRWDDEFINVENQLLFEIILAANYMEINSLLDLSCQATADRIKNKSPEYVRRLFKIENDFTPAEEEVVRKDGAWAFEGIEED